MESQPVNNLNTLNIILIIGLVIIVIAEGIVIWKLCAKRKEIAENVSDINKKIEAFRQFWLSFVVYVISTSIICLFLAAYLSEQNVTLNDINTWVSLILGMIALIIGIISLFLSFYNVDQSNATQNKTSEIMENMQKDIIERFKDLQIKIEHKIDSSRKETIDYYDKHLYEGRIKNIYEQPSGNNEWEISNNEES